MVQYSFQMERVLYNFFSIKSYNIPIYVGNEISEIRFNNHNFNPVFLRISSNQDGNVCEIPSLICSSLITTEIVNKLIGTNVTPLSIIESQKKRTVDSIFKYFFFRSRNCSLNCLGLKKVTTSKGEVYYGAPGLILNSIFEPIAIGLSEYKSEGTGNILIRHVLKVSPDIFISDGLLEKAIIKKLIPFYTKNKICEKTVRVEVDDISKYIVKPIPPKSKVQETMKEMLCTYKDEILKDIIR